MSDRTPYFAANWKMNKTIEEAEAFLGAFLPKVPNDGPEVIVCPSFLALKAMVEHCAQSRVRVAAQNMHEEAAGAFTGEVSAPMLREVGVDAVILGHSERRQYFNESDEALARKVPAALSAGLEPIVCVGETEEQRDAEDTHAVLSHQVLIDLAEVGSAQVDSVVIAYEPVWAIGTGRTATPEQAQETILFIRNLVRAREEGAAERIRIVYGGSVKPDNAADLMAQPDIDGALVGGASLDADDFAAIVAAAQ
ncbi:MAG: triose-phosphate isomerase [Actinomycetota bacterium]